MKMRISLLLILPLATMACLTSEVEEQANELKNPISETGFLCAPETPPELCDIEEGREEGDRGNPAGIPGENGESTSCTRQDDCASGERCVALAGYSPESGPALTANEAIERGGYCQTICASDSDCGIGDSCQVTFVTDWESGDGTCWPADNCGDLDFEGQCNGNVLSWCNYGVATDADCESLGGVCGEDENESLGFNCIEDNSCTVDADCSEGFACYDSICAQGPYCEEDADCEFGSLCDTADNYCSELPECTVDADCGGGFCDDGHCFR